MLLLFFFTLHGIPFEMPHAGSPNSTPYHPKCHTLASEMAGIYPPKPWGFREKALRFGTVKWRERMISPEQTDNAFEANE